MSYEANRHPNNAPPPPYHPSSWSYQRSQNIPEEYTITVEDTSAMHGTRVVNAKPGMAVGKVPPPVMPKPRNVSQV